LKFKEFLSDAATCLQQPMTYR